MIKKIYEDDRAINGIHWNDSEGSCFIVGIFDCTKIVAYGERGLHYDTSFFAVYKGEEIISRVPATQVQVVYAEKEQTDGK